MSTRHDPVAALGETDLNLLVAFDVLARTGSVTHAAADLGVTQSGMSHALRRLREELGDPLFVRAGGRWVLTPRAEALRLPIRSALVSLARALAEPDAFDPATADRTFRLAAPDLVDLLLVPPLVVRFAREAPRVSLAMVPALGPRLLALLETGEVDLAIVPETAPPMPWQAIPDDSAEIVTRRLFVDRYRCFARAGHPALVEGRLTLDAYLAHPHLLVAPTGAGAGLVDQLLAGRGLARRIGVRVTSFAVAPRIVAETDLLLTAPSGLARVLGDASVAVVEPPIEVPPSALAMVWHRRLSADPGHRWLRDQLVAASGASALPSAG